MASADVNVSISDKILEAKFTNNHISYVKWNTAASCIL